MIKDEKDVKKKTQQINNKMELAICLLISLA